MAIMTMKDVKRIKSLTQVFYMVRMKQVIGEMVRKGMGDQLEKIRDCLLKNNLMSQQDARNPLFFKFKDRIMIELKRLRMVGLIQQTTLKEHELHKAARDPIPK